MESGEGEGGVEKERERERRCAPEGLAVVQSDR